MDEKKQKKNTHPDQTQAEREEKKTQREYEPEAQGTGETEADSTGEKAGDEAETELSEVSEEEPEPKAFPIVGIGASAGGLEALETFFANLPSENGMACVVITHTDPKHASLLPNIIGRKTDTPVKVIEEGMPVEENTIYLPPSDRDTVIEDGAFRLHSRPGRESLHMPIDLFFRSLAAARLDRAGCVILSWTGTDGTYGVRAIKEKSGLAIAQRPDSAKHQGMPNSAIETGMVDNELRISRFTQEATRLINLIESDIGRPLEHISTSVEYDDLAGKARKVLDTLSSFEDEVCTDDGHWYRMNLMVHRTEDHVIEGVVMTFINIDKQKLAQQEIEKIGKKKMLLNARHLQEEDESQNKILLAIEEVTDQDQ